jgi:hypothetical protein
MHYKSITVEHRTCPLQDGVKSRPCSLKTSLRLVEKDEGAGHTALPYTAWMSLWHAGTSLCRLLGATRHRRAFGSV